MVPLHQFLLSLLSCVIAASGELPLRSRHLHSGNLWVIGLSEIGFDFCRAGSGVTAGFERGSPRSLRSHVHTCLPGMSLHFEALLCLWPWSLESRRKCIPLPSSEWSHNTQLTRAHGPPAELGHDIVAVGKKKTSLKAFCSFFISLLI